MRPWFVYLLRCADGSLYAGVTTDLARRLRQHREGRGARYTRARGALEIAWSEEQPGRSAALRREAALKRLSRARKLRLLSVSRTGRAAPRARAAAGVHP